jgi:hypothetical protein
MRYLAQGCYTWLAFCCGSCVNRACLSAGKFKLVTLMYQAARQQGGSEDCMPSFRHLALQAAVATQSWEEGGYKMFNECSTPGVPLPRYLSISLA